MGIVQGCVRGIPCSPNMWGEMRDVCQLQTTVGLCACTLGWAVSESIVGIVQGCVRGFPAVQTWLCELQDNCWSVLHALWDGLYVNLLWGQMRDVLRGIPCGPTQLCELQTSVGLCACTLGWAVSESIVG